MMFKIYIAVTGLDRHKKGASPSGYGVLVRGESHEVLFWGRGWFNDPSALYAHAFAAAINHVLISAPDLLEGSSPLPVEVIAESPNFLGRLKSTMSYEVGGRAKIVPDEHEAWRNALILRALGEISSPRAPNDAAERQAVKQVKHCADHHAELEREKGSGSGVGLSAEGECEGLSRISTF